MSLDNDYLIGKPIYLGITSLSTATNNTQTHTQSVASTTWTITHNFDKNPSVTILDSENNVIYTSIKHTINSVILTFCVPVAGKAILQ